MSNVKDMSLADEGIMKIEWVQKHMPVLEHIKYELFCVCISQSPVHMLSEIRNS